jgi:hypothetical protein
MNQGEWGLGLHTFTVCRWSGGQATPPPHTYSSACNLLGNKAKQKGALEDKGCLPHLFWKLILRLGFFDEVNHIILFIIGFEEDF